eukprot:TRINITY_DN67724_c0_g1_i1.p1 TRINITY_DN67724_c0_g1~~TRINITY_DN67724_c0_g1_i1.p1  ORF type:complete len:585 (+),score=138.09 TRINITY_DN67724_c0_g1_i1:97-1851(+)
MRRRGVDQAWDALEEMMRAGLPSDRFTVSRMLMRTLADGRRHWDVAKINRSVALVEQFVSLQPAEADEVLFNAILDTHSRTKDIARLEATFQHMQELGVEASHVTLGILVKAYGQVCDIKQVMRLWDDMHEQREQANAVTYGCMINACVKCSQTEKALEIFRDMQRKQKQCNTILYTTLIKGYGNEKDLNTAIMLFREMKDQGVPYNTIAYNSIIDVCIKCSEVAKAEDFFKEMIQEGSQVQPDLITYSTLLKGYCQVGDLDKALQVAATIKACGMQCDELVYNTLMDGCVKANDLSAGVGLFAEMASVGMKPSSITHSIFLRLYQRNGYKGNALDAVAQLYQHHGLEKPSGTMEKASKAAARRDTRGRGQKNRGDSAGGDGDGEEGSQGGMYFGGSGGSKGGGCGSNRRNAPKGGGCGGYPDVGGGFAGKGGLGQFGKDGFAPMPSPGPGPGMPGHPSMMLGPPHAGMMHGMDDMLMQPYGGRRPPQVPTGPMMDASQRTPGMGGMMPMPMVPGSPMGMLPGGAPEAPLNFGITSRPATFRGLSLDEASSYAQVGMRGPPQVSPPFPGGDIPTHMPGPDVWSY